MAVDEASVGSWGLNKWPLRRVYRVSDLGKVGPVEGRGPHSTVLAVSRVGGNRVGRADTWT